MLKSNLFFFYFILFCALSSYFADSCTLLLNTVLFVSSLSCFRCLFLRHLLSFSPPLVEAKRSQSISNCAHLYEALPTTKSVPMLLHTVSSFLPGISSGNSACSHRLSGKVHSWELHVICVSASSICYDAISLVSVLGCDCFRDRVCIIEWIRQLFCSNSWKNVSLHHYRMCMSLNISHTCHSPF